MDEVQNSIILAMFSMVHIQKLSFQTPPSAEGPSIYDVRTRGGMVAMKSR